MSVEIVEVRKNKHKRIFLNLPARLHAGEELWVPPLKIREKRYIDPRKNNHLDYSDIVCFLAFRDGEPVGRIMGIINHKLNDLWNDKQARFCNFEAVNDEAVSGGLLRAVEDWARNRGMKRVVGPLGFSNQDPQGFLIEGFNERPSIGTIYNARYIPELIEKAGYSKEVDYVTYKIPIPDPIPPLYEKISERVRKRTSVRMLEFNTKREAKPYLSKILKFMNETYTEIYGFLPLSEDVIKKTARTYYEIMEPRLLKVILNENGEIVGFVFGIQDITEGFQKAKGKLFPFGYFRIKKAQRRSKRVDLLLGAIKKEYRGKGLDTIMAIAMIKSAKELGMEYGDSHHELESNTMVQAEMKRLGGFIYKRHRVYQKVLM